RLDDGQLAEVAGADIDEPTAQRGELVLRRRHDAGRVDVGNTSRELGERRFRYRTEGVRDQDAVVVVLDRAVVFGADRFDDRSPRRDIGRGDERGQPAVGEPTHPFEL